MTKKIRISIIITIAFAIGFISIKKAPKTNVTLVGMIHNTKNMDQVLLICDSRTIKEADFACKDVNVNVDEINNLCQLRLDINMSRFTNKCLRYYRMVERVRHSQEKVSEFLKLTKHDYLIHESINPDRMPELQNILSGCKEPNSRPTCLLKTDTFFLDGWFKEKKVDYLFEEAAMSEFIKNNPNFEEDIAICKDYQIERKCKVMNEFMKLHSQAIEYYLRNSHGKDVIVIMGQEYMNYVSCKNFDMNRYECKDVLL